MTPAWVEGERTETQYIKRWTKCFQKPVGKLGLKPQTNTHTSMYTHIHLGCRRAAPCSPKAYNGNRQRDKELKARQASVPDNRTSCPELPLLALVRSNKA